MTASNEQERLQSLLAQDEAPSLEQLLDLVTEQVYSVMKSAVELGKWPDGSRLQGSQLANCMQLVIMYEHKHLPEQERTGFNLPSSCQRND